MTPKPSHRTAAVPRHRWHPRPPPHAGILDAPRLQQWCHAPDVRVDDFRPFNHFGPGQAPASPPARRTSAIAVEVDTELAKLDAAGYRPLRTARHRCSGTHTIAAIRNVRGGRLNDSRPHEQ